MTDGPEDGVPVGSGRGQMLALFAALVTYVGGSLLVGSAAFGLLAAAIVGIGVRIYLLYHVSRKESETRGSNIGNLPTTGDYHYGAVGAALVLGPVVTAPIAMVQPNVLLAIGAGAVATVLIYAVTRVALPK